MSPPDLSVVIVTHNSVRDVHGCLSSLARECAGLDIEIVVVDSGSSDGTSDFVRQGFPSVRVIASAANVGFAAANNMALPFCRGRYVLLLNPDTIVVDGAPRALLRYLDDHARVAAVGPTLRLPDGTIQTETARRAPRAGALLAWLLLLDKAEWTLRFGHRAVWTGEQPRGTLLDRFSLLAWARDRTCAVELLCGACLMIRRDVVQAVGELDDSVPLYLDDIDYCRRLRDAGWEIHYLAEAAVVHLWQQSSAPRRRDGDFYAMGCHAIWSYLRKHDGPAAAAWFSAMAVVAALLRLLACAVLLVLPLGSRRPAVRRHMALAAGLGRWALRWPRRSPRLGFTPR